MKIKERNPEKYIHFLLENSTMPVAVLEPDGTAIQVNDSFRERFQMEKLRNIKDLLDGNSAEMWEEISRLAKKTDSLTYEVMILLEPDKMVPVKVKIMYCDLGEKVIVLFDVPPSARKEAETTQIKLFHKVEKLTVLLDKDGFVRDINELCYEFFTTEDSNRFSKSEKRYC